ncbi:putative oxidoreductase [Xylaria palmicola]|nr:putative oxidoreductase [Xylaria palmicola]
MGTQLKLAATCCAALAALFPNITSFPSSQTYNASVSSYSYLQAASLRPDCVISPETTEDVARAVRLLTHRSPSLADGGEEGACPFAIRSGGHASKANAANIDGGVTFDLRRLNSVSVDPSWSTASVGVGNTWGAVYAELDAMNLSVNGGRVASVGVGGLSLGGGISFSGTRYGWTSDTITNFEVVLANGSIVDANATSNPDLHWALRGSSNNLGVVTRIDLETFEQGPIWGGTLTCPGSAWADTARELAKINSPDTYDEYAALFSSWVYSGPTGTVVSNTVVYTKAVENPQVFAGFTSLPRLAGTTGISNLSSFAVELDNQPLHNRRLLWATNTMVSTEAMINATYFRFNESLQAFGSVADIVLAYTLEPFPPALYARHGDANPFGLGTNKHQSLLVSSFNALWTDPADDDKVEEATRALIDAIDDDAKRLGAYNPFLYLNYGAPWQDPIASYGAENVKRLRKVVREVDPEGVFTHQVPGGFKIR